MKIVALSATDTLRRLDDLNLLVRDAVAHGASLGFALPLESSALDRYWRDVAGEIATGGRRLFMALDDRGQAVGSGQLRLETGADVRHRAEVQQMAVRSGLRGRGVGAALMVRIEHEARTAGRTLLVLDAGAGTSEAASFYRKLGYAAVGTVAAAGEGRVFFKQLAPQPPGTSVPLSSLRRAAALG